MSNVSLKRRKSERKGRLAELAASAWLMLKGYSIIERRYKSPVGEIDLIVKRGNLIAFIEVKARKTVGLAVDAVTPAAQRRICAAAGMFFSRRPNLAACGVRYDILAVTGLKFTHIRDAWRDRA